MLRTGEVMLDDREHGARFVYNGVLDHLSVRLTPAVLSSPGQGFDSRLAGRWQHWESRFGTKHYDGGANAHGQDRAVWLVEIADHIRSHRGAGHHAVGSPS